MSENAVVAKSNVERLKIAMSVPSVQEQFQNALKEKKDNFVASLIDLYGSDTYLQKCEPKAVIMEALKAATLNLPINKALGFAYVVPYGNTPTFQIGYKGLIQLAMRTGQYRYINANVAYEGEFISSDKLTGSVNLNGKKKSDNVVGYFAYIELLNGFSKTLYWTKDETLAFAKKYSKAFKNGPWQNETDKMGIKTVLRYLLTHYGFLSTEMIKAIEYDYENESVDSTPDGEIKREANKVDLNMNVEPSYKVEPEQEEPQKNLMGDELPKDEF